MVNCDYSSSFVNTTTPINQVGDWEQDCKTLLSDRAPIGIKLLNQLQLDLFLKECFLEDAGVAEGYTVGQHTRMVLEVAEKYKGTFQNAVEKSVTWNEFLLFLCLHDIGKGRAASEHDSNTFRSSLTFKEAELAHTQQILVGTMTRLGIDAAKIQIFSAMLMYDTQGLYLKGDINIHEAFDNILEMLKAANMEGQALQFYELFAAFHMVDAASYPCVFGAVFDVRGGELVLQEAQNTKAEALRSQLENVDKGKDCLRNLIMDIDSKVPFSRVMAQLNKDIPSLSSFLKAELKYLCTVNASEPAQEKRFKETKTQFKKLLRFLAQDEKAYKEYKNLVLADISQGEGKDLIYLFSGLMGSRYQVNENYILIDTYIQFRRQYLCRYSIEKITKLLQGRESHIELLGISLLHGSRSTIWPGLYMTSFQLIPKGRLDRLGVSTMSGELGGGVDYLGINQSNLSGVSLNQAETAIEFGYIENYNIVLDDEIYKLEVFLQDVKDYEERGNTEDVLKNPLQYNRLCDSVRRVGTLAPERLKNLKDNLKEAVQKVRGWIPQPQNAHEEMMIYLSNLEKVIEATFFTPPGVANALKDPYPTLFASTKVYHRPFLRGDGFLERVTKSMKVGEEVDFIFTPQDRILEMEELLSAHKLTSVQVSSIEALEGATALNRVLLPYFFKIAGMKEKEIISNKIQDNLKQFENIHNKVKNKVGESKGKPKDSTEFIGHQICAWKVPSKIFQMTHLTSLTMGFYRNIDLPPEIGTLTALKNLELIAFKSFPYEMKGLTNLETLKLSGVSRQVTEFSVDLSGMTKLNKLSLQDIKLSEDHDFSNLQELKELTLENTKLSKIPESICKLVSLERLDLYKNAISEIPDRFSNLGNLRILVLTDNRMANIPAVFAEMKCLVDVKLMNNLLPEFALEDQCDYDEETSSFIYTEGFKAHLESLFPKELRESQGVRSFRLSNIELSVGRGSKIV